MLDAGHGGKDYGATYHGNIEKNIALMLPGFLPILWVQRHCLEYFSLKYNEPIIMQLRVGSGLPNIQVSSLLNYCINIPIVSEQTAIAEILSSLDDKIELNNQINKDLEETANQLVAKINAL